MRKQKRSRTIPVLLFLFTISLCVLVVAGYFGFAEIKNTVTRSYGPAAEDLSLLNTLQYSFRLYTDGSVLAQPVNFPEDDIFFEIALGESIGQISFRLKEQKLISDADVFRDYLVYRGYDRSVQTGFFKFSSGMNALQIAEKITDPVPDQVQFSVLAGWRAEEIAAVLPRSGLSVDSEAFLNFIHNPPDNWFDDSSFPSSTLEGYLAAGHYVIDREIKLDQFVRMLTNRFQENLKNDWLIALSEHGLGLQEAIILASIVEREAVIAEEMPLIASVFLNRYNMGMKLDSDPTVQFALGFNARQASWWSNPLTSEDLQIDSLYNTYLYSGLPPAPICNPGLEAIKAVVFPQTSPYYYFRAKCDGSGLHNFAETYDQHLENGCP